MKLLYRLTFTLVIALGQIYFQPACSEEDDTASIVKDLPIQKSDVSGMLDSLVQQGMIKKEDAEKAKTELSGMDQKKFESLTGTAKEQFIKADGDPNKLPKLPPP